MAYSKQVQNELTYSYLFGRDVLKTSLKEDELNEETIKQVLFSVLPTHFENRKEIDYLQNYYKGNQDILCKTKIIRPEINNKVVENNAYHFVEFKKGYVLGDPIQYVQRGATEKSEIELFNSFMINNDKATKDIERYEDMLICGTGYALVFANEDEDKPFVVYNADPKNANVVYSTSYDNEPILCFYITEKIDYEHNDEIYYIITVYTKKQVLSYQTNNKAFSIKTELELDLVKEEDDNKLVNWTGELPIVEYPLNKSRLGLIELSKSIMDTLNKISSNDIDGIEQYVQSLLVLYNVDIDSDEFKKMVAAGAILANNHKDRGQEAKIEMIGNKLDHSETKVLFDRLYNNMLTIVGIPRMTDKASSGDTGQARLIGEGWSMADQKAKQDELSIKLSEKQLISKALKICKEKNTGIKNIKASDIEIKFTRNKSDNMLVKAETLQLLKNCQIAPDVAIEASQLFSDSADVVKKSQAFFGDDFWQSADKSTDTNTDVNTDDVAKPITV